jgi:hypothetical protein
MSTFFTKQQVEKQLSDMWKAVFDMPDSDPDKENAFTKTVHTEIKIRQHYDKYRLLPYGAPDLIDALARLIRWANTATLINPKQKSSAVENAINVVATFNTNISLSSKKLFELCSLDNMNYFFVIAETVAQAIELVMESQYRSMYNYELAVENVIILDVRINCLQPNQIIKHINVRRNYESG